MVKSGRNMHGHWWLNMLIMKSDGCFNYQLILGFSDSKKNRKYVFFLLILSYFILEAVPFKCPVIKMRVYRWYKCNAGTELSVSWWLKCAHLSLTIIKADKPQCHHSCAPVPLVPTSWKLQIQNDKLPLTTLESSIPKRASSTGFHKAMFASWLMPLITKF